MSEITVTVPLSVFDGADISATGILAALGSIDQLKTEKDQLAQGNRNLASQLATWAEQLKLTLNGDYNMMDKFRMLRELSSEATRFSNQFLAGEGE